MEVDDLVPISALQHFVFCPRQAALIHIERVWQDDVATNQGHIVHVRVDRSGATNQAGVRVARALPLVSSRLGIFGFADMVELHPAPDAPHGVRPVPVEVKKGTSKNLLADQVQLCAQALCLEEAFNVEIGRAWIFYSGSHRRREIPLNERLRATTAEVIQRCRSMISSAVLPPAVVSHRVCAKCSLRPVCLPDSARSRERARRHLETLGRGS
jgi:CRISPR-associated exonuclease Cas4